MLVDAAALSGSLRAMPALAWPGLSERAQAALAQAVMLAGAPASAREAVSDAALAGFANAPAPQPPPDAALPNPWAAAPPGQAPAPPAPSNPRARAIAAVLPAPPARAATPAAARQAQPATATPNPAEAVRASLAAAESLLREGGNPAAAVLEQARAAAGRMVRAQAAIRAPMPLRRLPFLAEPSPPAAALAPEFATADALLARLQESAGDAGVPEGLFAALATVRTDLAGLASQPSALAIATSLLALAPRAGLAGLAPASPAAPTLAAPRVVPVPGGSAAAMPEIPAWAALPAAPEGWGRRLAPPALPLPAEPMPEPPAPPPFGPITAGALAGIAAAGGLMRRNGLGGPGDPGAFDELGETIESWNTTAENLPPLDNGDYARLMQWCGLARQVGALRAQLGLDPWDPEQQPAMAEALRERARWMAERQPWPGREAASAGLTLWLPVVDCAEALDLPTRGEGALRRLGRAVRETAATHLPPVRDVLTMARTMAALDAMATLWEALGIDPTSPEAAKRLRGMARALEGVPNPPETDTAGALDHSTLDRLRGLDRAQAGELGLEALGENGIPLLSGGLPVLATLDAARRLLGRPPFLPGRLRI